MHCMQTSTVLQFINIQSGPFNVRQSLFQKKNNVFENTFFKSLETGNTQLFSSKLLIPNSYTAHPKLDLYALKCFGI